MITSRNIHLHTFGMHSDVQFKFAHIRSLTKHACTLLRIRASTHFLQISDTITLLCFNQLSHFAFSVIVDKIDADSDGFINLYELQTWIKYAQRRYIDQDMKTQWTRHNKNNSEQLHWEVRNTYILY